MVLGIQKDGYPVIMPDAHMRIEEGDVLWIIGANNSVARLAAYSTPVESKEDGDTTPVSSETSV